MLNEKKVKLMTEVASYESSRGKEAIKIDKLYEKSRAAALFKETVPMGIITFILSALLVAAFGTDWMIAAYEKLGIVNSCIICALIMIAFVALYCIYSSLIWERKHSNNRGRVWKYKFNRSKLKDLYEQRELADKD